jgi:uncharacterized membrane protein
MLNGIVHAHSGLRWVVLALLIYVIYASFVKWQGKKPYTESDRKAALYAMLSVHIQLLLGLFLYFAGSKVDFGADFMKDPIYRFFMVEHLSLMLIAIVLVTLGYTRSKKAVAASAKFKTTFWYYVVALLLILLGIPWPFRGLGTGWF